MCHLQLKLNNPPPKPGTRTTARCTRRATTAASTAWTPTEAWADTTITGNSRCTITEGGVTEEGPRLRRAPTTPGTTAAENQLSTGTKRMQLKGSTGLLFCMVTTSCSDSPGSYSSYQLPRQVDRVFQIQVNRRLLQSIIVTLYHPS